MPAKKKPTPKKKPAKKKTAPKKTAKKTVASTKIRVSALAKQLGKTSKELLQILKELDISAKTAASSIDKESAKIVEDLVHGEKAVEKVEEDIAKVEEEVKEEVIKEDVIEVYEPEKEAPKVEPPVVAAEIIILDTPDIIVKDLAKKLSVRVSDLIKEFMKKRILVNINQKVTSEVAAEISKVFNKEILLEVPEKEKKLEMGDILAESPKENLRTRPPIVTILGHVDHGKTKLLDAIRQTKVAEGEAGGITQHIGAYQVEIKNRKVTFLDTPGHEAFTALRARGAKITDIAVLVVAADDGVMPQTIEAIDHAKAAKVPIIVAINKIDIPDANPDKVKQQLTEHQLVSEDWGGDTIMVPISAKQQQGIEDLLEMILLVADVQELKADPTAMATGVVVESKLDKGRGPVATVLIKNGTLRVGDPFCVGKSFGKVRAMINEFGERLKEAPPSTPAEFLGSSTVPQPGDVFQQVKTEQEARKIAEERQIVEQRLLHRPSHTLEDFSQHIKEGERQELKLILKGDVRGSLEALGKSLAEVEVYGNRVAVIHKQAGAITESDVLLAEASNAIVVGFNTSVDPRARALATDKGVEIRLYNIIYKVIDDVKLALEGMLKPIFEEAVIGKATVRQTFKYSKVGVIAGCFIDSGKFTRGAGLRVFREEGLIYQGKVDSLKRFKEDVKEVGEGYECGISIQGYTGFKEGDRLECFEMKQVERGK